MLSGLFTGVVTLSHKIGRALFFSVSDTVEHLHRSPQVEVHLQVEEHLQLKEHLQVEKHLQVEEHLQAGGVPQGVLEVLEG